MTWTQSATVDTLLALPQPIFVGLAWVVASTLLVSGLVKLRTPMNAARAIRDFGLTSRVHIMHGVLLGGLELSIGLAILLLPSSRLPLIAATLLFACFVALISRSLADGESFSCGCLSTSDDRIGKHTLIRATLLLLAALFSAFTVPGTPSGAIEVITAASIAAAAMSIWTLSRLIVKLRASWSELADDQIDWYLAAELVGLSNHEER